MKIQKSKYFSRKYASLQLILNQFVKEQKFTKKNSKNFADPSLKEFERIEEQFLKNLYQESKTLFQYKWFNISPFSKRKIFHIEKSQFFPFKQSFIIGWVFPFLGFMFLTKMSRESLNTRLRFNKPENSNLFSRYSQDAATSSAENGMIKVKKENSSQLWLENPYHITDMGTNLENIYISSFQDKKNILNIDSADFNSLKSVSVMNNSKDLISNSFNVGLKNDQEINEFNSRKKEFNFLCTEYMNLFQNALLSFNATLEGEPSFKNVGENLLVRQLVKDSFGFPNWYKLTSDDIQNFKQFPESKINYLENLPKKISQNLRLENLVSSSALKTNKLLNDSFLDLLLNSENIEKDFIFFEKSQFVKNQPTLSYYQAISLLEAWYNQVYFETGFQLFPEFNIKTSYVLNQKGNLVKEKISLLNDLKSPLVMEAQKLMNSGFAWNSLLARKNLSHLRENLWENLDKQTEKLIITNKGFLEINVFQKLRFLNLIKIQLKNQLSQLFFNLKLKTNIKNIHVKQERNKQFVDNSFNVSKCKQCFSDLAVLSELKNSIKNQILTELDLLSSQKQQNAFQEKRAFIGIESLNREIEKEKMNSKKDLLRAIWFMSYNDIGRSNLVQKIFLLKEPFQISSNLLPESSNSKELKNPVKNPKQSFQTKHNSKISIFYDKKLFKKTSNSLIISNFLRKKQQKSNLITIKEQKSQRQLLLGSKNLNLPNISARLSKKFPLSFNSISSSNKKIKKYSQKFFSGFLNKNEFVLLSNKDFSRNYSYLTLKANSYKKQKNNLFRLSKKQLLTKTNIFKKWIIPSTKLESIFKTMPLNNLSISKNKRLNLSKQKFNSLKIDMLNEISLKPKQISYYYSSLYSPKLIDRGTPSNSQKNLLKFNIKRIDWNNLNNEIGNRLLTYNQQISKKIQKNIQELNILSILKKEKFQNQIPKFISRSQLLNSDKFQRVLYKNLYTKILDQRIDEKRKAEKLFRSYLSCKYNEKNGLTDSVSKYRDSELMHLNLKIKMFNTLKKPTLPNSSLVSVKSRKTNSLFKRIGLIFLNDIKRQKWLNNPKKQNLYQHILEQKNLQKKRRFKKQRRETRRRTKRKRFYPRPIWLRYPIYEKFLKNRHVNLTKNSQKSFTQIRNKKFLFKNEKSQPSTSFNRIVSWSNTFAKTKIYRLNKGKWGQCIFDTPFFEKIVLRDISFLRKTMIAYENRDIYKISNQMRTEFNRLSLTSDWFNSNLAGYLRRIETKLKKIENQSKENSFLRKIQWLLGYSLKLNSNFQPLSSLNQKRIPSNYINIKKSFQTINQPKSIPFSPENGKFMYYNKILSKRIEEEIRHIKDNVKIDGQPQLNFFKFGRNYFNQLESKGNFFGNGLNQINYFQQKNQLYNEFPRLRVYWALNQTNVFGFQQTNSIQKLWSHHKKREQTKANDTKEMISNLLEKYRQKNFENIYKSKMQTQGSKLLALGIEPNIKSMEQLNSNAEALFSNTLDPSNSSNFLKTNLDKMSFPQKNLKRSLNFWWLQNNSGLNFENSLFLPAFDLNIQNFYHESPLISSLWLCLGLIHLSALISLLSISEVRSLIKFYGLILYKLFNHYVILMDFLFDFTNKYKDQFKKNWTSIQRLSNNKHKQKFNVLESYSNTLNPFENKEISFSSNAMLHSLTSFLYYGNQFQNITNTQMIKTVLSTNQKRINSFQILVYKTPNVFYSYLKVFDSIKTLKSSLNFLTYSIIKLPIQSNFLFKSMLTKSKILSLTSPNLSLLSSFFSLILFSMGQKCLKISSTSLMFIDNILLKTIDILDTLILIISKFLEKPAEFMMDWIAQVFLVEWSSDYWSYIPEAFDTSLSISYAKWSRGVRMSGFLGTLILKRFWTLADILNESFTKPDADLIMRQKKGLVFWDIWGDILVQAADQYNINIPSLTYLNEERNLLIQRLLSSQNLTWWDQTLHDNNTIIEYIQSPKPKGLKSWNWNEQNKILSLTPTLTSSNFLHFSGINLENKVNQFEQSHKYKKENMWKKWSVNQYSSYEGKETDLFVDVHPTQSFKNMNIFKHSEPIQQPIATLVCQIYSGLLSKQISKNLLVIGAPGTGKGLFVQAIAGETEFKLISDHANRYTTVSRGIAVGMKLLRDVFDALALHTPCLFLLEDIHLIGERRPLLISDDENAKATEPALGFDKEEVHEKNQVIYQLNRHSIFHYQKPYKGDFSLLIPTNHFCFDLFLGENYSRLHRTEQTPLNPLSLNFLANEDQSFEKSSDSDGLKKQSLDLIVTKLQTKTKQIFSPPSTSPFTVLLLKEQKKLKPRKIIKQVPWSGISSNQMQLISKSSYSIRTKVSLLANTAFSNLSAKLDMITDLLVIIDSVRSNRGFVVFATTHLPYVLDPALRRPGRLDEKITIPLLPNVLNRFEILKTRLSHLTSTLDLVDYSLLFHNQNQTGIYQTLSRVKLSLAHLPNSTIISKLFFYKNDFVHYQSSSFSSNFSYQSDIPIIQKISLKRKPESYLLKCIKQNAFEQTQSTNFLADKSFLKPFNSINSILQLCFQSNLLPYSSKSYIKKRMQLLKKQSQISSNQKPIQLLLHGSSLIQKGPSNVLSITYYQIGQLLIRTKLLNDYQSFKPIIWSRSHSIEPLENSIFLNLYSDMNDFQNQILHFFGGKIGEYFVYNLPNFANFEAVPNAEKIPHQSSFYNLYRGLWSLDGIDHLWRSATSLIFSLFQKRYFYSKNTLALKFLDIENQVSLKEPPSPLASTLLGPSKKFENFKRTQRDFQTKLRFSINEKLQMHQQQRLIKTLYSKPIQTLFKGPSSNKTSHGIERTKWMNFNTSFAELGYLDSFVNSASSVHYYYRNRILFRHRFYCTNQWWTGQLAEANTESTFLSDVDWRYMFIPSLGDIFLDFPDADQHYNPRNRRWMNHSSYWGYLFTFDKVLQTEIYYHYTIEAFNKAYLFLDQNREILDYFAFKFLNKGMLKRVDLVTIISRFYLSK